MDKCTRQKRSKTEYISMNEREDCRIVGMQGVEVAKVDGFKYLTVQSDRECGKKVKKRM